MARKKKAEEHENHERWLVSYADFITLLFAFFVVMYSMSSVNEGKYRVLAESMSSAFRGSARSLQPIQIGQLTRSPKPTIPTILQVAQPMNVLPVVMTRNRMQVTEYISENEKRLNEATAQIGEIASNVEESLAELIDNDKVTVRKNLLWLEVEIKNNVLFNSASAELSSDAEGVLSELGLLLKDYPNRINVEGFTDDRPIQSLVYPSNWELSSARAAAVVRLFANYGIEPVRMASVGFGEFRPSGDNTSEIGRASNRKVIVVIMADIKNQEVENLSTDIDLLHQRISIQRYDRAVYLERL